MRWRLGLLSGVGISAVLALWWMTTAPTPESTTAGGKPSPHAEGAHADARPASGEEGPAPPEPQVVMVSGHRMHPPLASYAHRTQAWVDQSEYSRRRRYTREEDAPTGEELADITNRAGASGPLRPGKEVWAALSRARFLMATGPDDAVPSDTELDLKRLAEFLVTDPEAYAPLMAAARVECEPMLHHANPSVKRLGADCLAWIAVTEGAPRPRSGNIMR